MMALAGFLLLTALAGLWRLLRGPTRADRLLPIQFFGTTGTTVLLILAQAQQQPALRIVALLLALLAAVVPIALVQYLRRVGD
jgi:multicomponent Na+:H+ antiporter subunit F